MTAVWEVTRRNANIKGSNAKERECKVIFVTAVVSDCCEHLITMSSISFWLSLGFALAMMITVQGHSPLVQACPEDDRRSLLDVKGALKDLSGRLSSWHGYNCCQWQGVVCDYHAGHVISLDLKNKKWELDSRLSLSGEIHPSLFNLQHLQYLDLSYNDFNGSAIPPQLAKLKSLAFLSLAFAQFGGEIPMELGNLSTLRHLDLSIWYKEEENIILKSTRFAEWVRNLKSLEYLVMQSVDLSMASEQWGDALTILFNLRQVHLISCELSGSIPSLLNLTHLTHLHLQGNLFSFSMPTWFQNVSSLISLDLANCDLRGIIPPNLLHRSRLSDLDLSKNPKLTGNLSFILSHSSSLTSLSLNLADPILMEARSGIGGVIRSVNFSKLGIGGVIPSSIANFSKLERLDLAFNNLTGDIPYSLGRLASLRYLDLSHNQIDGTIPFSLGRLASLVYLDLSHNQLDGTIPLSLFDNLTHLELLFLSHNHFSINISPSWNPQFIHLYYLALSSCNLQGGFPEFLSTQYSLEDLDLSDNSIVGGIPIWLWVLPNLEALNLSNNKLNGHVPHLWSASLDTVDLHSNGLQGSLPYSYCQYLDLSENEFNGSSSFLFARGINTYLFLSGNNLSGLLPDSFCSEDYDFTALDLSKNKFSGKIPPNLGRCSYLEVLSLAHNDLQGEIPGELGNLTALSTLNLRGNRLQGNIPSSIANCKDLNVFDVGHNKFEGSIPAWIGELTQLQILSFTHNKFSGNIPLELVSLHNLHILDLSQNHLTGIIPQNLTNLHAMVNQTQSNEIHLIVLNAWGSGPFAVFHYVQFMDDVTLWMKGQATSYTEILKALKFIDLSCNNLSGNIPSEIGSLKGLISLNISRNNLSGSIPETVGGIDQLESLDLSANKLSGKIPQQLVNLTSLEVLNLSDNKLSGLIPQGKQFWTFEASSFAGNPNLHGSPLDNTTTVKAGRRERGSQQEINNRKTEADAVEDEDELDIWWAVALGLSFGVGFGLVVGVLFFHVGWRIKYFAALDGAVAYLFER